MKSLVLFSLILLGSGAARLLADSPLAPMPARSHWKAVVAAPAPVPGPSGEKPAIFVLSYETIKTPDLRCNRVTRSDQSVVETWIVAGRVISESQSSDGSRFLNVNPLPQNEAGTATIAVPDFPELAWLQEAPKPQTQEIKGNTYLVFSSPGVPGDPTAPPMQAWVDVKTRRPFRLQIGGEIRDYQFDLPIPATLTLPERFATALQDDNHRLREFQSRIR